MTEGAQDYFDRIEQFDRSGALGLVEARLSRGETIDRLLDLVAASQTRVGELWQASSWSVAHEHAATAINQSVVDQISLHQAPATRGGVAVACLEDEWHSMPALLVAERLRFRGWDVIFLGAATPANSIENFLSGGRLVAVVASSTIPTSLAAVPDTARAAHAAGLPMSLGGRSVHLLDGKTVQLGVDHVSNSIDELHKTLGQWEISPPTTFAEPRPTPPAAADLIVARVELIPQAMELLFERFPDMASYTPAQLRHTEADFGHHLDFLAAALLLGSPGIYETFIDWLWDVLDSRGVPLIALTLSLDILAALLESVPDGRDLLLKSRSRLAAL